MHITQTIQQMREMHLTHMAESFDSRLKNGDVKDLSPEEFVSLLIDDEYSARNHRKLSRMISKANFKPNQASMEDIEYSVSRGLEKKDILIFTQENWIKNAQTLVITGATGSGKTYLAEAIGYRACQMGFSTQQIRYSKLLEEISQSKGMGQYIKYLEKMEKIKLLIIDDFAITNTTALQSSELLDVLDNRDQRGALIITSQYPIAKWHNKFQDPTIADAILDRIAQGAHKINLKGGSLRNATEPKSKLKS